MCVIYIFTLFSTLYFQAVLTTADNHTRAVCKHCSLYFDVPPKPIFSRICQHALAVGGQIRALGMHPGGWNPGASFACLVWGTVGLSNSGAVGLAVQFVQESRPIGGCVRSFGVKNRKQRGIADFSHYATMRSGYFSDSASYLFIISSSRSLRNCNVSEFEAWLQICCLLLFWFF